MLKKKGKALVLSIISAVLGLLTFVSFGVTWATIMNPTNSSNVLTKLSYKQFSESFLKAEKSALFDPTYLKLANVVMIIALICVVALAVLTVLSIFVDHKVLKLVAKILGIVTLLILIAYVVLFMAGGMTCFKDTNIYTPNATINIGMSTVMVLPMYGAGLIATFGVFSAFLALLSNKRKKEKNN